MPKQYSILAPVETHFRPARCAEVDCPAYLNGFKLEVDETTPLGQAQAHYLRGSGRPHVEYQTDAFTVFSFAPGQECFRKHQKRIERDEIFVADGRRHTAAEFWVEDFAEHQDKLKRLQG